MGEGGRCLRELLQAKQTATGDIRRWLLMLSGGGGAAKVKL